MSLEFPVKDDQDKEKIPQYSTLNTWFYAYAHKVATIQEIFKELIEKKSGAFGLQVKSTHQYTVTSRRRRKFVGNLQVEVQKTSTKFKYVCSEVRWKTRENNDWLVTSKV